MAQEIQTFLVLNLDLLINNGKEFKTWPFKSEAVMFRWRGPLLPVGTVIDDIGEQEIKVLDHQVLLERGHIWTLCEMSEQDLDNLWEDEAACQVFFDALVRQGWVAERSESNVLNMRVMDFFTRERLSAEDSLGTLTTRVFNQLKFYMRGWNQEETMRDFLAKHSKYDLTRMTNLGRKSTDLMVRTILSANLTIREK